MMIEVLGTGCAKCNKLEAMARAAADKLGVPYEITHVQDINAIVQRGIMTTPALAIDGQVVIRPMMYLAMTYDHRIIYGKEAVQFLVTVKEQLEDPSRLLLQV